MRILLIITDYGSFNNFLSELAVQLITIGHEVHVICSPIKVIQINDKYPFEEMGVVFHYVEFPRSFNIIRQMIASVKIHKIINEIDPYLINIHFTTGIFTTVLRGKPAYFTVGTIHGVGYPAISSPIKRTIFKIVEKFCFKRLDQIYLINTFDFELVKKIHPQKAFKYNSFGVGNDLDRFDPSKNSLLSRQTLRKKLCVKEEDFVLVFTGRFAAFKGFDKVIKAFNSLINQYELHNIKLMLIGGEDPIHTNGLNERDSLEYKRNENIIRIDFTTDVDLYLGIADVFVFPSSKEGMPVCIMEALSMGVPVITSDSRGCKDLISHNSNGILLKDHPSVAEVREAILKLYRNRVLLKELSANALKKRKEYSREVYVEDQIKAYDNILTSK